MIVKEIIIIIFLLIATKKFYFLFLFLFLIPLSIYMKNFIKKEKDHRFIVNLFTLFVEENIKGSKEEALEKINEAKLHYEDDILENLNTNYPSYMTTMFCEYLFIEEKESIYPSLTYMLEHDNFYKYKANVKKSLSELVFTSFTILICSFVFPLLVERMFDGFIGLSLFCLIVIYHILILLYLFDLIPYKSKQEILNTFSILKMNVDEEAALNMIFIIYPFLNKNKFVRKEITNFLLSKEKKIKEENNIIELLPSLINLILIIVMSGV